MKLLIVLGLLITAQSFAGELSCKKYAQATAVKEMNKQLKADRSPEKLEEAEKARLSHVIFLDSNDAETKTETGTYGVEMIVLEECYDSLKITTEVIQDNGKKSCQLVKVEAFGDRDCG